MTTVYLSHSNKPDKKYMVLVGNKTIHFGASGYEDYTTHKDHDRMIRYNNRHQRNENWTMSGIGTAGFWSKHLLWSETTLNKAIRSLKDRFGIRVVKLHM